MVDNSVPTCLVGALKKCKQSSKEAVENLESFSSFKHYMHVKRQVETELEDLIVRAYESKKSQLILVCGGVGDGKSHIISYLKQKHSFITENNHFRLHNDATESFEPQKTSIQTLAEVFKGFSDENLDCGEPEKAILAINLGALNNFIDSTEGKSFSKLRDFVEKKKILEAIIEDNSFDEDSNFQFINFSDYHMFQLSAEGPRSDFMDELLLKVTSPTAENPFYQTYQDNCLQRCPVAAKCPIKHNYEFLSTETAKNKIIDVLIQASIKEKLIISTRGLLNFIHDLLVSPRFESLTDEQVKSEIGDLHFNEYIDQMLPVLMFTKPDSSPIHHAVQKLSPTQIRSEQVDSKYIEFRSRKDGAQVFEEYVVLKNFPFLTEQLVNNSPWKLDTGSSMTEFKQRLMRLFVYLFFFAPKKEHECFTDFQYTQFMTYLYYWNTGQVRYLQNLYKTEVHEAIFKWDGEGGGNHLYVQLGQNQTRYHTIHRLEIEPVITNLPKRDEQVLNKFLTSMTLQFKARTLATELKVAAVDLDFSLYRLLSRIRKGYRPNKSDKFLFIRFVEFISKLSGFGNQFEEIFVEEKQGNQTVRFSLSYDPTFEQYTFVEV